MGWKELRANARDIVHTTFALPALYTSADGATIVARPVQVRLHNKLELFGDLERGGFAKMWEEINQILFDSTQVVPEKNAVVDFSDGGDYEGIRYTVVNKPVIAGSRYIRCEVTATR